MTEQNPDSQPDPVEHTPIAEWLSANVPGERVALPEGALGALIDRWGLDETVAILRRGPDVLKEVLRRLP